MADLQDKLEEHVSTCGICSDDRKTGDAALCSEFNRILSDFQDG